MYVSYTQYAYLVFGTNIIIQTTNKINMLCTHGHASTHTYNTKVPTIKY